LCQKKLEKKNCNIIGGDFPTSFCPFLRAKEKAKEKKEEKKRIAKGKNKKKNTEKCTKSRRQKKGKIGKEKQRKKTKGTLQKNFQNQYLFPQKFSRQSPPPLFQPSIPPPPTQLLSPTYKSLPQISPGTRTPANSTGPSLLSIQKNNHHTSPIPPRTLWPN